MSQTTWNEMPPVAPGVFTRPEGGEPPQLVGGSCARCERRFFPRPSCCPECLGPLEAEAIGAEGTVYTFTVVRARPPMGLPQPYGVGYVDLEASGLRVFGLLDPARLEEMRIGLPVRLAVGPLGRDLDGAACLRPYFTPRTES